MLINAQTKIAALLKHHQDALETIVTLSPDFKKLRNPILRKLMAGRTSIAMASKIGGCTPEDFFKALAPLGFEVDTTKQVLEEKVEEQAMPAFLQNRKPEEIVPFDVRAILASGEDPLRAIQEKAKALQATQALLIINNFEPVPLIKLLEKQGFQSYVQNKSEDEIHTYFFKTKETVVDSTNHEEQNQDEDWDEVKQSYANNLVEIDVRHLEAPMPMMTILENLETLPEGKALFVNHKRIPVFLLDELNERKFNYRIKEVQEGEVYLLIFK